MLTHLIRRQALSLPATALLLCLASYTFSQIPKFNSNSAAPATVYLDFDGHLVEGTAWNWDSTIHARPAALPPATVVEVFNRVAEDYRIFNINITTDSGVYARAPIAKRVRIIVTPTSHWYGVAGGVSYVGSFIWGDGTPGFVFSDVLQNNPKYIAEACSHEAGHTLGLQHQSTYDKNCNLVTEYAEGRGDGEIGWAPIMGVSYYKNLTTWEVGKSILGCSELQNDISTIAWGSNNIGLRADDYGNTMASATAVPASATSFVLSGLINSSTDVDVFKVVFPRAGVLKTTVAPGNVGAANAGGNLDIKISLVKSNGDTIGRYNPAASLSASIDTNLTAGTYYLVIDGVSNQNFTNYNSTGYYTVSGGIESNAVLPVTRLTLRGTTRSNVQVINWEYESDEPVNTTVVEASDNGQIFETLATVAPAVTSYENRLAGSGRKHYRIKMLAGADNTPYYSNVISLECRAPQKVELLSNIITSSAIINSPGNYNYDFFDPSGRLLQRGKLTEGYNTISITSSAKGLMLLKVYSTADQALFKVIKQ